MSDMMKAMLIAVSVGMLVQLLILAL